MLVARSLLGVLALLLAACSGSSSAADCARIAGVREGLCPLPADERLDAPIQTLPALTGEGVDGEISLGEFDGRVVVVNFWASWCGPCRAEQPDLNEAFETLPSSEVAFVGVNVEDSEANAAAHIREFDIPYPSVYDPANVYASQFKGVGPRTIPSTVFIDAQGRVAARVFGVVGTGEVVGLADAIAAEG